MRSLYGPGRLLLASKKPRIQALIKRAESLSVHEIQQLTEKPDIIRGLLEIKELGTAKATTAELIADRMQQMHKHNKEAASNIYQYYGDPFWIKTGLSELEIQSYWHWMEHKNNEITISSNKIKISIELFMKLKKSSRLIKAGFFTDLLLLEKDRVSKLL